MNKTLENNKLGNTQAKGEQTMENKTTIDHFANARVRLLTAYFNAKLNQQNTSDLTVELACIAQYGAVNTMVTRNKIGSKVELIDSKPIVTPEGKTKTVYTISIKDLDINAKSIMTKDTAKCKAGTELPVFRNDEIARAVKKALV